MKTITKKELVHRIAERTGVTKVVAKEVIQSFLNSIIEELADGNRLEFREFGVFESRERAARLAQAGDLVIICSYARMEPAEAKKHKPTVLLMDANNKVKSEKDLKVISG